MGIFHYVHRLHGFLYSTLVQSTRAAFRALTSNCGLVVIDRNSILSSEIRCWMTT